MERFKITREELRRFVEITDVDYDGEQMSQFTDRCKAIFEKIVADVKNDENVLVFTHGGVIRAITSVHLKFPYASVGNTDIAILEQDLDLTWTITRIKANLP